MSPRSAGLYLNAARYSRPWQIIGRAAAPLRRKWATLSVRKLDCNYTGSSHYRVCVTGHDPWNEAHHLLVGRFRFLNDTREIGFPPQWHPVGSSLLWQFNLHYFHYLPLLSPSDQKRLCRSWISGNPIGSQPGWHSYPMSLRIINWCRVGHLEDSIDHSLYAQAAYLYRNLETQVLGNHLLENARALVHAGSYFRGAGESELWLNRGIQIYEEQIPEQVLPDGGHFERSPMYHGLVLEGLLDVLNLIGGDHPRCGMLREAALAMVAAFQAMLHGNGSMALFNDATHEIGLPPAALLRYADEVLGKRPPPRAELPYTGYYTFREGNTSLIIDGGACGPDHLMAHAHADIFSFEFAPEGVPLIVDSGVFEYGAGPMRDYVRSTRAHNTVEIEGTDQIECWGSFRVGRRYAPIVEACTRSDHQFVFKGRYEGYKHLLGDGIAHHRAVSLNTNERYLEVRDTITGRGIHTAISRIHFHPQVEITDGGPHILFGNRKFRIEVLGGALNWEDGWYCPEFGVKIMNRVAAISNTQRLPFEIGYRLYY